MAETKPENTTMAGWTEQYDLDQTCSVRGSDLCWKFANSPGGCGSCYVHTLHEPRSKDEASERWEQTVKLLPRNIDELSQSDTCWLCRGMDRNKADGFAVVDMANPEPYSTKGILFGIGKKVRTPVGSLISLHIAACDRCRKAYRKVELLQFVPLAAMIVLGVVLLMIPQISVPMLNAFSLLPAIFLVLMAAAGYAIGRAMYQNYMRQMTKSVNFDIASIPLVDAMLRRGWFFFQTDHGSPRLSFTRKRGEAPILPPVDESDAVDPPAD